MNFHHKKSINWKLNLINIVIMSIHLWIEESDKLYKGTINCKKKKGLKIDLILNIVMSILIIILSIRRVRIVVKIVNI